MGRPMKNPPQTQEQMMAVMEQRKNNQLFSRNDAERSANEEAIGRIVQFASAGVQNVMLNKDRVRLDDTCRIQEITGEYLNTCAACGMTPSMTGLSMAIGCTLHAIDAHLRKYPDSESSAWFRYMKAVFAEILSQAMLSGKTVSIPSIFVLKACYNWKDDPGDDLTERSADDKADAKTIMEKYVDLPD